MRAAVRSRRRYRCWCVALLLSALGSPSVAAGALVALGSALGDGDVALVDRILQERLPSRPLCVVALAGLTSAAAATRAIGIFAARAGREAAVLFGERPLDAARVDHPDTVAALARCGGVFFPEADASGLTQALRPEGRDSALLRGVRALLAAGGVVIGSGASAAALGGSMILEGRSAEAMRHGVTDRGDTPGVWLRDGLGFDRHLLIDLAPFSRGNAGRAMVVMADRPVLSLAIGVDEGTLAVLKDGVWETLGVSCVLVLDTRMAGRWNDGSGVRDGRLWVLSAGDRYVPATQTARAALAKLPLGPRRRRPKLPGDPWSGSAFLELLSKTAALGDSVLRLPSPKRMLVLRSSIETEVAALRGSDTKGVRRGFFAGPIAWDLVEVPDSDTSSGGSQPEN